MSLVALEWIERVSLYCGEGTSDKVYHQQLLKGERGYFINIQYGKRIYDIEDEDKSQTALQKLTKPDSGPTTYAKAKELFDEKLKEKLQRKRYQYYQSGHVVNQQSSIYDPLAATTTSTPAQSTLIPSAAEALTGTGYIPQLLNATTPGGCESFLKDETYYGSPKADGIRFILGLVVGVIAASNRRGEGIPVPGLLEVALTELVEATGNEAGLCLDGELIGNTLYVFDLLELGGQALSPRADREHTPMPYFIRARQMQRLARVYAAWRREHGRTSEQAIKFLPIARTESEKRKLYRELLNSSAEGIVFTQVQSVLKPGKPNTGGDRWKFKFNN